MDEGANYCLYCLNYAITNARVDPFIVSVIKRFLMTLTHRGLLRVPVRLETYTAPSDAWSPMYCGGGFSFTAMKELNLIPK